MKNTLFVDFANSKIVMDRTYAINVRNTNSHEYAHLQEVRRDYPTFTVTTRQIKKNPNKDSYKGLTYEYMHDYIITYGTDDDLEEFEHKILVSKCHSQAFRYPVIKKWFLDKFPDVKDFLKPSNVSSLPQADGNTQDKEESEAA